jgi:nitrogen fixation/metabolism regulation signal transduction histidine kinase
LQQALDNLIANALEHGGGRVFVEGELRGGIVCVLVSDGGLGLPRDPDAGAKGSSSARGHGLSIVRKAIHEHNGTLGLAMGRNGPGLLVELPTTDPGEEVPGRIALRDTCFPAGGRASKAA